MQGPLTVRDLLLPGEPLDPSEVVAGEEKLSNPVSWAVSLRPFPPAFPPMRGGELALVATEHLSKLDTNLLSAVSFLADRGASGVAVRGAIGEDVIAFAREKGLPLLRILSEMHLQDIEQAVMRECALQEARREMQPLDRYAWIEDLLGGKYEALHEVQSEARRQGISLASHYSVLYITLLSQEESSPPTGLVDELEGEFRKQRRAGAPSPVAAPYEHGIAVLLPQGWDLSAISKLIEGNLACGIGSERTLASVRESLAEAQLAAIASALLRVGKPTRYAELGADRLLVILHRDHPDDLHAFVEETLGPLLKHDARSATPLLPTVEAFVQHAGRLRETAADIYVHRNTLAYRLERAEELLRVDLKDAGARLAVELALRARRLKT